MVAELREVKEVVLVEEDVIYLCALGKLVRIRTSRASEKDDRG